LHRDIVRRFPENIANSEGTPQVTGHQVCSFIVNIEQVQVQVEHQGASVLSVHLQLLHGANGATVDIEELKVD